PDIPWGVCSIPPLEYVLDHIVMTQDTKRLALVNELLEKPAELKEFQDMVTYALQQLEIFQSVLAYVKAHPGCLQKTLGKAINRDGRRIAVLITQAEKRQLIYRQPSGSTYKLFDSPV
ncbi:MAG TPA: hypothetical protein VHP58_04535, partial [Alphaproteobacteria bacterium]|nr:hypothetical protein [Alphaproteobacteria bacterium]